LNFINQHKEIYIEAHWTFWAVTHFPEGTNCNYVVLYPGFGAGMFLTREINKDDIRVLKGLLIKSE
jgi:hypothetical protein